MSFHFFLPDSMPLPILHTAKLFFPCSLPLRKICEVSRRGPISKFFVFACASGFPRSCWLQSIDVALRTKHRVTKHTEGAWFPNVGVLQGMRETRRIRVNTRERRIAVTIGK